MVGAWSGWGLQRGQDRHLQIRCFAEVKCYDTVMQVVMLWTASKNPACLLDHQERLRQWGQKLLVSAGSGKFVVQTSGSSLQSDTPA